MFYEFEEEIKALEECDIKDKEKLFYIYTDFYLEIIATISNQRIIAGVSNSFIRDTQKYLTAFFKDTIKQFNLEQKNEDYIEILEYYFKYIHEKFVPYAIRVFDHDVAQFIKKIVTNYIIIKIKAVKRKEHHCRFFENITNNLNLTNLDFRAKAISILNIKYYIEKILWQNYTYKVCDFLGGYTLGAPARIIAPNNTIDKLIACIPAMVSGNEPISFEILREKSFQFLNEEISKINPGFDDSIRNKELLKYYLSLDENNKKLFWQVITRFLSGYPYDYEPDTYNKKSIDAMKRKKSKRKIRRHLGYIGYDITGRSNNTTKIIIEF